MTESLPDRERAVRTPQQGESIYARFWDQYAESWDRLKPDNGDFDWPGDEWGNPEWWARMYQQLFVPAGVEQWERAVEIGPGSGKYTLKVLESSKGTIRGYDISASFLQVCKTRCDEEIKQGRLSLHMLNASDPASGLSDLTACGWRRKVDGFYSIASMVHVDLQYLIAYFITAGLVLRPQGKLVMTLATPTNELGFEKLLGDISIFWRSQSQPSGSAKFEWVSPDMIESILSRLGFDIDLMSNGPQRDLHLVASLRRPDLADQLERYLVIPGDESQEALAQPFAPSAVGDR
jgi:hypothetical protein